MHPVFSCLLISVLRKVLQFSQRQKYLRNASRFVSAVYSGSYESGCNSRAVTGACELHAVFQLLVNQCVAKGPAILAASEVPEKSKSFRKSVIFR